MEWMQFYFANPTPDRLVDEVCALDAAGALDPVDRRIVAATFLGRVFAASANRVPGWLDTLSERLVSEGARNTLQIAAYFSNTVESREWMARQGGDPSQAGPAPDPLAGEITDGVMLDVLWAYYFATGDARAVRKLITMFNHLPDAGAADRLAESAQTADDHARAANDRLYQAAAWSLMALMKQHPPLLELCGWMLDGPDLTPDERLSLGLVLERAAPDVWSVEIHPEDNRARIRRRTGDPQ